MNIHMFDVNYHIIPPYPAAYLSPDQAGTSAHPLALDLITAVSCQPDLLVNIRTCLLCCIILGCLDEWEIC